MLLLDTATVLPEDRVGAFRAAFDQASVPCRIEHLDPPDRVHSRMHLWSFGAANVFTTDASGFRLVRTPRHVRRESPAIVALAVQSRGEGRFHQFGTDAVVPAGELMLSDLTAPYQFSWAGSGGSRAFQIPYELLGLPPDVVRAGAPRLRSSPLYGLVREHLERLTGSADRLSADPGAAALGTATVGLVRALLVSAAGRDDLVGPAWEETLVTRVRAYASRHLTDPALTPGVLAAAHNVSVRRLYQAFADAGISLEQELIGQRLEAARAALVSPAGLRRSIEAVARACGFDSPSHFSRRFRQAYGLTPREWRQQHR
ncbi:helix-turn-helix domain-containing protein [Blastococcus sp. TF02A-26]|uniref:AraC-like ligand-binding domain-containing protein n=1 Tax=Blastococcus sp. TF02A-26 TaxID=2250577 RepID=UPI000DE96AC1|nr:helix-turn-helix domain-containing protein [Blastococcus sp. TF02A-26]RBY86801.1 AraC family transcriptional regulator [Blastococcus sp. TF02A-26]